MIVTMIIAMVMVGVDVSINRFLASSPSLVPLDNVALVLEGDE